VERHRERHEWQLISRRETMDTKHGRAKAKPRGRGVDKSLARHGGLSYLAITAVDARRSAAFYEKALGWKIDWRSADDARFSDSTGHLIGRWVVGRRNQRKAGFVPYFYVDGIERAFERAVAGGGEVVEGIHPEGDLQIAMVRDPAGNVIGLWEESST
jgi:uncharacterized protein